MGSLLSDGWYCSHNTVKTVSFPLGEENTQTWTHTHTQLGRCCKITALDCFHTFCFKLPVHVLDAILRKTSSYCSLLQKTVKSCQEHFGIFSPISWPIKRVKKKKQQQTNTEDTEVEKRVLLDVPFNEKYSVTTGDSVCEIHYREKTHNLLLTGISYQKRHSVQRFFRKHQMWKQSYERMKRIRSDHMFVPVHCQKEEPEEVEERLHKRRAFLYGRVLLCVRGEHHRCTRFVL